jgi:hypothetical protein
MVQTRKTAPSVPKVSFTLTGAQRKVTAVISKLGKENIKAQEPSKVTAASSTRPKPVARPVNKPQPLEPQARTSSQGGNDADTADLLATIAKQQGLSIHLFLNLQLSLV